MKKQKPYSRGYQKTNELTEISNQAKRLVKNPMIKDLLVIGAVYGLLFISKYIIKEYAEVVVASKKLRDAYRL
ncbi:hypothetical protein [Aquimarina aquimarini]|uniref:hypothetical protein n=1 Tax=Aquimarina aquimarini TaxID=1191734 RepID=UPI000D558731|nr:hypothetical protein [Aquimarina aquimarini]